MRRCANFSGTSSRLDEGTLAVAKELLALDMLTVFSFRLQPSFLGWSEAPRSETDSLFRDEKRMQVYLADYHFTNWRDLKMRYRIWPVSAAAKSELGRTAAVPEGPAWLLAEKKKDGVTWQVIPRTPAVD
jgi:anaerobic magnesium-protoporphyrin IX monomethyl ester cyclase